MLRLLLMQTRGSLEREAWVRFEMFEAGVSEPTDASEPCGTTK